MNEDVIPVVHQWINGRDVEGTIKYGQPLRTFDGRNTDTDAIEEALDLVNYLVKRRMEREEVADLLHETWMFIAAGKFTLSAREIAMCNKLNDMELKLRADAPRIGVPMTRQEARKKFLPGGPMSRPEDMEKS